MFQRKDKEEELLRLQQALLAQEEPVEELPREEAYLDDGLVDTLLEEDTKTGSAGVYQNFSNGYGKDLRNFASGYKAYNSDKTDTDLEKYSEAVRKPKKGGGFIIFLLILVGLLCITAAAMIVYHLRLGGIL